MIFTKGSTVTSAPASEPLTTSEAKNWLKIEDGITADDTLVDALVTAAREYVETSTGLALFTQTVREHLDEWPEKTNVSNPMAEFHLMRYPVQSVTSITYLDSDGNSQTLSADTYIVDTTGKTARIALKANQSFPPLRDQINAVTITYVAGWDNTANIPEALKTAMKLLLTYFYERRADSANSYKTTAEKLIEKYSIPVV